VVFHGEKYNPKLHTRVFITDKNLPTYEAKDIAHALRKYEEYKFDKAIIVTANEQDEYFKVVLCALNEINSEIAKKTTHISHGLLKLDGEKMASRKGNVITGEGLINAVEDRALLEMKDREFSDLERRKVSEIVAIAAIKYSILRQSTGGDIIFDFEKSLSFEGDSGPYLQYSCTRANSVLEKAKQENILANTHTDSVQNFELERLLYKFPEIVERSVNEYEPHYIANYLIEIARSFNSFYGNNLIVKKDDTDSPYKVALTAAFSLVMQKGLYLLGIEIPERM
jgi:arginyl-tRNA synthetase